LQVKYDVALCGSWGYPNNTHIRRDKFLDAIQKLVHLIFLFLIKSVQSIAFNFGVFFLSLKFQLPCAVTLTKIKHITDEENLLPPV
jgi:hypothetical protein